DRRRVVAALLEQLLEGGAAAARVVILDLQEAALDARVEVAGAARLGVGRARAVHVAEIAVDAGELELGARRVDAGWASESALEQALGLVARGGVAAAAQDRRVDGDHRDGRALGVEP